MRESSFKQQDKGAVLQMSARLGLTAVVSRALSDEGQFMNRVRTSLETVFPVCGDLLLGQTRIRRVPLCEVKVPKGAHIMISNNRHCFTPSAPEAMRQRCDALLNETLTYNLLYLNCEHFATFIRYGKAVCNQVRATFLYRVDSVSIIWLGSGLGWGSESRLKPLFALTGPSRFPSADSVLLHPLNLNKPSCKRQQ